MKILHAKYGGLVIYNLKLEKVYCKLSQVDVRKFLNHFFTHTHDYDVNNSRDLLELLPHNLKQKNIL